MATKDISLGITADATGLEAELRKARGAVSGAATQMKSALSGVGDATSKLMRGFQMLGVTISVGALGEAAKAAIEFGDEMQKAAARTGVGASEFSTLALAAKSADIDIRALSAAFNKMQVAVSEASSGNKNALTTFAALGIKFEEFKKLSPEQQFLTLADHINALKDPADRVRASVEMFGKAGADLLPFFEQGAAGIQKAREEIERMGGKLTDEQISKLADADTAIKNLTGSWQSFARALTAEVAPQLASFFNKWAGYMSGAQAGQLRGQIEFLKEFEGRGGLMLGAGPNIPSGFYSAEGIAKLRAQLEAQLAALTPKAGASNAATASSVAAPGYAAVAGAGTTPKVARQRVDMTGLDGIEVTRERINQAAITQANLEGLQARRNLSQIDVDIAQERMQAQLALGLMTEAQAIEAHRQFANQRFAIDEEYLQQQIAILEQSPDNETRIAAVYAQIEQLKREHVLAMTQADADALVESQKYYTQFWQSIDNGFRNSFAQLLQGTMTFSGFMRAMLQNLTNSLANLFSNLTADFIKDEILKTNMVRMHTGMRAMLVRMGLIQETAAQTTASATTTATKTAEAGTVITANAGEAASGAAASQASIPFVGPVLAAAAFAAMMALVMGAMSSIRSAAGGYDIPSGVNPMTQLHGGEMVLPAKHADVIRALADGGGAGGGAVRIINTVDPSITQDWMNSAAGERVILNVIRRNPGSIRQILS